MSDELVIPDPRPRRLCKRVVFAKQSEEDPYILEIEEIVEWCIPPFLDSENVERYTN